MKTFQYGIANFKYISNLQKYVNMSDQISKQKFHWL